MKNSNKSTCGDNGGKSRQTGLPCEKPAGYSTNHLGVGTCCFHLGNTKNHQQRAVKVMAENAVATFGLPRTVDPAVALLEEIARTAGHVDWLGQQIQDLDPDALTWGLKSEAERTGFEANNTTTAAAGVHIYLDLYQKERAHLVRVCAATIGAGIAVREVELAERQGALAAEVVRAILSELGLSEEQRALVPGLIRRHLALVPALTG